MSVSMNNLFNYAKSLPEPFNTLANKKVKVSSKYGDGTQATLCATVIKAIHAVCNCMEGTGEGAVGSIDHRTVAEYKSAAGTDIYHLVVFDSSNGNIMASVYDKNTETIENYQLHSSARDGAAVMMALVPLLMKDDEFDDNFQTYFDQRVAGYPDMTKTTEAMAILCDNAYRRIKDDTCSAHIKVTLDKSGNVLRVSQSHLLAGVYTPTSVLAGEFTVFAQTGKVTVTAATTSIDHKDFVGKYQLTSTRKLSGLEEMLVPKLEDWYIIPEEVVDICKHALDTTGKPMQMAKLYRAEINNHSNRMAHLMFKMAVELAIQNHLLAAGYVDLTDYEMRQIRNKASDHVRKSRGFLSFEKALEEERELNVGG